MRNTIPTIKLIKLFHRDQLCIGLKFRYNDLLLAIVRALPFSRWSQTHRLWYLPFTDDSLKRIYKDFKAEATLDISELEAEPLVIGLKKTKRIRQFSEAQKELLNDFFKYLRGKRYSKSTIDTYVFFVADFIEFHKSKNLEDLNNRDVELYLESVFIKRKYSVSTQRQFISALKLFIVFDSSTQINDLQLTRPNKDQKLPNVLSQHDIIRLITTCKNLKHRAIITLLYSGGLRIGELINLRLIDIHIERRQIFIRNSKGRKDRYVSLAESFLPVLQNYLVTYKPEYYFVEGLQKSKYSASSVRKFLQKYVLECGITSTVTPHVLRHSYATHLMENGVGIRHIQELLGHSRPETTMIYTHVARKDLIDIKSPLDRAVEELKKLDKQEQKLLLSRK